MRRAVILAGGLGTRLRPYTTVLPKPLMPIGDRPILDIVIRQLAAAGFEQVTIATGYLAELIEAFFGDGSRHGVPIDYFREDEPLGTVGALSLIEGLDEDFLVMNGDILTDLDYRALLDRHCEGGQAATIAARIARRAGLSGSHAVRCGRRPDSGDRLRGEALVLLRGVDGGLLLRASGPRLHFARASASTSRISCSG